MLDTQLIVVTHSWPLLHGDDDGVGGGDSPALQHPHGAPIEARAQFDATEERSLISVAFAKFLLDGQAGGSSTMSNYIAIRWRRRATTDTLETTHLKVVPDRDCEVILFSMSLASHLKKQGDLAVITTMVDGVVTTREFGSAMEYGQQRRSPTTMLTYIHKSAETGAHQSSIQSISPRTRKNPVPLGPNQLSQVRAGAASHGIHFMNWETIEALAPLFPRLPAEPCPTPFRDNESHRGEEAGDTTISSETLIHESDFEVPDHDKQEQDVAMETASPSPAPSPKISAFLSAFPVPGSPNFPPIGSNLAESGDGGPQGPGRLEEDHDMDISEDVFDQSQKDDFDVHPGHREWEWDVVRERWRRRDRSTAADWFPLSFA